MAPWMYRQAPWNDLQSHVNEAASKNNQLSMPTKGLFTWREEDPRRWNNFTLGLHAEISAHELSKKRRLEKGLKMADNKIKNAIWVLLLS